MKYFDYAATCPLDQEAAEVYVKAATNYFGNTRSLHDIGSEAATLLENCRTKLANLMNVSPDGLYFTSGGSESNYLAIQSLLSGTKKKGNHVIVGMAEHSSVNGTFQKLEENGYEVTPIPYNEQGRLDLSVFRQAVKDDTVLVSLQFVNPEIGTFQPIKEVGEICKQNDILFHSDCVQAFGKTDFKNMIPYLDSFSISGHKFYGPKGIGAVYMNPNHYWKSYYPNASHENGFRPGTLNVPAIAAMTVAAEKSYKMMNEETKKYWELRQTLVDTLNEKKDRFTIYGDPSYQLPSTLGIGIHGKEGQWVMLECNRKGFAISTGSACRVGMDSPSVTLNAMGVSSHKAKEFIRISFGRETTKEDVFALGKTLLELSE